MSWSPSILKSENSSSICTAKNQVVESAVDKLAEAARAKLQDLDQPEEVCRIRRSSSNAG
jgi:hypothetical protein